MIQFCGLILLGVLFGAPLCFGELLDSQSWNSIWLKARDQSSQKLLVTGLPVFFLAQHTDSEMKESWMNHQQMPSSLSSVGDRFESYGIGPLLALTQYLFIDKNLGEAHIRAVVLAGSLTQLLKISFQRNRPDSSNQRSFPSGHTSSAFASASLVSEQYGWKVGIWAYPLAGFVGLSRIADNRHWLSDVVAGAYLGTWLGRACAEVDSSEQHYQLIPVVGPQKAGLVAQFLF